MRKIIKDVVKKSPPPGVDTDKTGPPKEDIQQSTVPTKVADEVPKVVPVQDENTEENDAESGTGQQSMEQSCAKTKVEEQINKGSRPRSSKEKKADSSTVKKLSQSQGAKVGQRSRKRVR